MNAEIRGQQVVPGILGPIAFDAQGNNRHAAYHLYRLDSFVDTYPDVRGKLPNISVPVHLRMIQLAEP
jgi:hypothetical protein